MARWIDGRSLVRRIDEMAALGRRALSDAIASAEDLTATLAQARSQQAGAYGRLADLQIDAVGSGKIDGLEAIDRDISRLVDDHEAYVAGLLARLEETAARLTELESQRARKADLLDKAVEAYETKVAEVETALEDDADYKARVRALADAESVSEHARAKLAGAKENAQANGTDFRADPLFMYLWNRRYRTPDYKAGNLARVLDGWVAKLCHFDRSWRNYQRLVELPEWLAEHVAKMQAREAEAEAAVEAAETRALAAAGAEKLQAKVEKARAAMRAADTEIDAAEAAQQQWLEAHNAAKSGETGPAAEARRRLAETFPQLTIPDLRQLAALTATPEDDAIVDGLIMLRKDEMAMELRLEQSAPAPQARREDLSRIETFRSAIKSARLDSPYARFDAAMLDQTLARLMSGRFSPQDAVRQMQRGVRRAEPRVDPRFGGSRRSGTLGMPDIARDIGFEILKEMGRSSRRGGSPFGGSPPPRGRSPRGFGGGGGPSFPTPKKRGGFRTGGGF